VYECIGSNSRLRFDGISQLNPCFHHRLINRLRKYQKRGIEVIGVPAIGDNVNIYKMQMTNM